MEGTASANAKARTKLKIRIDISPGRTSRRLVGQFDNQGLFPDICTESGKWFRDGEKCFVATSATKHWAGKSHDFSSPVAASALSATGGVTLGHWPSAAGFFRWTAVNPNCFQGDLAGSAQ